MIGKKMEEALNKQVNAELGAAYLYLSMAAYFDSVNYDGMAGWMRSQAQEEVGHAMKFFANIQERGGRVVLDKIDAPKTEWDSPKNAFEDAHKHECKVSKMIHDLVELAEREKDYPAHAFLQWFVTEQVEEEDTVLTIVERFKMAGEHPGALFMLDRELGSRAAQGH